MVNYNIILIIALIIVALSMLAMLIRVIIGPSLADRVVALDAMGIQFNGYHRLIQYLFRYQNT
ncbi:monovalent cation/H+ antiporter subunit F [Staphylococcus gallinarum]|uniref:Monovalent cation/H+ antiporter subunit F n=1 Tax=Staphylococcus gallinarum TaxID=1293 RepID=A0A380FFA9_STAGA|nr:monovalent cation/H+ antiporter subunit F [Staphylococcus gallinarum]